MRESESERDSCGTEAITSVAFVLFLFFCTFVVFERQENGDKSCLLKAEHF